MLAALWGWGGVMMVMVMIMMMGVEASYTCGCTPDKDQYRGGYLPTVKVATSELAPL